MGSLRVFGREEEILNESSAELSPGVFWCPLIFELYSWGYQHSQITCRKIKHCGKMFVQPLIL